MKKLDPVSLAIFQGRLFFLLGLASGIIYSFGGLIIDTLVSLEIISTSETPGLSSGTILAFGALVGMPAIGSLFGLITGYLQGVFVAIYKKFFKRPNFS